MYYKQLSSLLQRVSGRKIINYLHIGKTGGSQIKLIIEQSNNRNFQFKAIGHKIKLRNIKPSEEYFFSIREPVSRFLSAFYYRKNKGIPGVFQEWSPSEEFAFRKFEEANELAEALYTNGDKGVEALSAMQSIAHLSSQQIDWFEGQNPFFVREPLAIIRQEKLISDMENLSIQLNLPKGVFSSVNLDANKIRKNVYPKNLLLTPLALKNLKIWYNRDIEFYEACLNWIENKKIK